MVKNCCCLPPPTHLAVVQGIQVAAGRRAGVTLFQLGLHALRRHQAPRPLAQQLVVIILVVVAASAQVPCLHHLLVAAASVCSSQGGSQMGGGGGADTPMMRCI